MHASMKLLPLRRPQTSHASCSGAVDGALRPVCFWKMASCSGVIGSAKSAQRNTRHASHVLPRKCLPNTLLSFMASRIFTASTRGRTRADRAA